MPGIPQGILMAMQAQQLQASAQEMQAQTALRQKQTQALGMEMDAAQKQQLAQQQYQTLLQQRLLQGDPNTNNPQTPSIKSDQQQSDDQNPLQTQLREFQRQKAEADYRAKLAASFGMDPKPWLTASEKYAGEIRILTDEASKKKTQDMKEVAQTLRDVNSQESLAAALQNISDNVSKPMAQQIAAKIPKDPNTGTLLWNEDAKKVIAPIVSQATTMSEKETQKRDAASAANAQQMRQDTEARNAQQAKTEDARTAIEQQNADTRTAAERAREAREARLAENQQRRLAMAEEKAKKARDPSSAEAKATGKYLEQQLGMPPELSGKAAYDYLREKADALKEGDDAETADARALEFVTGRFTKGDPGEKSWFGLVETRPPTKPSYAPSHEQSKPIRTDTDEQIMKKLDAAGIKAHVMNGKATGQGGGPVPVTTTDQALLLPKGTDYVGPDGIKRTRQ